LTRGTTEYAVWATYRYNMTMYRFEFLDTKDEVSERRYIECDGKEAAVAMAGKALAQATKASGVEVWDGASLVKCLKKVRT
jgi:hypothetical protein